MPIFQEPHNCDDLRLSLCPRMLRPVCLHGHSLVFSLPLHLPSSRKLSGLQPKPELASSNAFPPLPRPHPFHRPCNVSVYFYHLCLSVSRISLAFKARARLPCRCPPTLPLPSTSQRVLAPYCLSLPPAPEMNAVTFRRCPPVAALQCIHILKDSPTGGVELPFTLCILCI